MKIRAFAPEDEERVIALWQRCGLLRSWNDPRRDIARKLGTQPQLFLVGVIGQKLVAVVMAGFEGHRGWVNYLAVDPERRRRGLGRAMMDEAERKLRELGCPKLNIQLRSENRDVAAFYSRLGFVEDDVVSLGKRLERDGDPGANAHPDTSEQERNR